MPRPASRRFHAAEFIGVFLLFLLLVVMVRTHQPAQQLPQNFIDHQDGPKRSSQWPRVRALHLEREPACAACGSKEDLNVHHILPFHLHPELEADDGTNGLDGNLITLCRRCHLFLGHCDSWQHGWNENAREDATLLRSRIERSKKRYQKRD